MANLLTIPMPVPLHHQDIEAPVPTPRSRRVLSAVAVAAEPSADDRQVGKHILQGR